MFILFSGGKRNEELILPINDSISGTLSTDQVRDSIEQNAYIQIMQMLSCFRQMCAKTSISADPSFTEDKMWLNGVEVNLPKSDRLNRCIEAC